MCFRPATAEAAFVCPNCGKNINPILGNLPDNCPFCEAELPKDDALNPQTPSGASAAPGAPSTPGAPAAPNAPK